MYTLLIGQCFPATARVLTSTAVIENYVVNYRMYVKRIMFTLTTTTSSNVSAVVKFWKYPVAASSSNAVLIGTLIIPTAKAAGLVYYKDVTPVNLVEGNSIVVEVTTAATSAGAGYPGFLAYEDAETVGNNSNMVASA